MNDDKTINLFGSFKELVEKESELLHQSDSFPPPRVNENKSAGEPYVQFTSHDLTGLALSGGGIRSATFNLGLLKGLNDLGLLPIFDYLSTVSGGGYIGSWWMAWRRRAENKPENLFPASDGTEAPAIRHLRKFSNFLSPRIGFLEVDTWRMVVTLINALFPSLAITLLLLSLALLLWLGLASIVCTALSSQWVAAIFLLVLVAVVQFGFESHWQEEQNRQQSNTQKDMNVRMATAAGMALVLFAIMALHSTFNPSAGWLQKVCPYQPPWQWIIKQDAWSWLGQSCTVVITFLVAALPGVVLWLLDSATPRAKAAGRSGRKDLLNRVAGRLLGVAVAWLVFSAIWAFAVWIVKPEKINVLAYSSLAGGSAGSGILARWLHKRLGEALKGASPGALSPKLKKLALIVLSYLAVGLAAVCCAILLIHIQKGFSEDKVVGNVVFFVGILLTLLLLLALFEPAMVSMHEFYRSRIGRAYIGASNPEPGVDERSDEQPGDDILDFTLTPGAAEKEDPLRLRPFHLVCAAANDLGGNRLAGLSRGARSGVLSPIGLAVGNAWVSTDKLQNPVSYSSAVTASAAAFNSNMGSLSIALGSAVTFLMSAINLRLGLWVATCDAGYRLLPGLLFLREMFGQTRAEISDRNHAVHLSDGGHFENLALYELIRRHCRYILVSDCGQDPDVTFDDFGNAQRRIREDFGVEIEIDLSPLNPDTEGRSKQHMVVGTIHYDGVRGYDKGVLLYFKPTLTNDEPADITNYKATNSLFPHESTGDQFYDEAQWESYRRLGEHAAHDALRFVEGLTRQEGEAVPPPNTPPPPPEGGAAAVFTGAWFKWYPTPPDLKNSFLEATRRFSEFERRLHDQAPGLSRSLFSEIAPEISPAPLAPKESVLNWLQELLQIMEDVVLCCDLDSLGNHPLNSGWMNVFSRWVDIKAFRTWWPLLKPMYSNRLQRFVEARLVGDASQVSFSPTFTLTHVDKDGCRHYSYNVTLTDGTVINALLSLRLRIKSGLAEWSEDLEKPKDKRDFVATAGYWGAGYGTRFVQEIWKNLEFIPCKVTIKKTKLGKCSRTDLGSRNEFADLLSFYRKLGFRLTEQKTSEECELLLTEGTTLNRTNEPPVL